ncbi:InlB B-repeat-containing protein [bacterium]|nr:InlB B-repeat-containing protein [bacterium]
MPETYTTGYTVLTDIDPLAQPTRTGYIFSGWFDNEELT